MKIQDYRYLHQRKQIFYFSVPGTLFVGSERDPFPSSKFILFHQVLINHLFV